MAGTRSALIVATYAYDDAAGLTALRAPRRDAEALSEVLGDPRIGDFEVRTVVNQPAHVVSLEVARFFADRRPDDLLLLHFSCHGVKDDSGELYFAATDTRLDLLEASAVSAAFVNKVMDRSRSSRVVLLLDCCYAGAFARGMSSRGGAGLDLQERLGGRGRVVITASTALQFSFEDGDLADGDAEERPSVFTRSLVDGLRSGEADRDQDGIVSLDELYAYVYDAVTATTPNQTPGRWAFGLEGDLHIARRVTPVTVPSELPEEIQESIESRVPWHRESVIAELERLMRGSHPGRALGARLALERLCDDDSRQVATHALTVLTAFPTQRRAPEAVAPPPEPAEPLTDFLPIPVREEPPAPQEPDAAGPAQSVPEEPVTVDPEPGRVREPPPGHQRLEPEAPATDSSRHPAVASAGGRGRHLSRRWVAVTTVAALAVAAAAWGLFGSREGGTGSTTATATAVSLPRRDLVLAMGQGRDTHLVTFDTVKRKPVAGAHTVHGRLPTISPGRHLIAYAAGPYAFDVHPRFTPYLARGDLTRPHPLFSKPDPTCVYATRAAWQPSVDDRLVLACKDADNNTKGLRVVDPAGRFVSPLKPVPGLVRDPTWGPHGRIVFARAVQPNHTTLWTLPSDLRGEPKPYFTKGSPSAPGTASDRFPDASDRGLLFLRIPRDGDGKVDLTNARVMIDHPHGHVEPVPGIPAGAEVPTWSPGERSISYLVPITSKLFRLGLLLPGSQGRLVTPEEPLGAPAWGSR